MEGLSIDNIMSGDEITDLFQAESSEQETEQVPLIEDGQNSKTTEGEVEALEDVDPEELFDSEGVGSVDNQEGGEKPKSNQEDGSSPNNDNFYSSIANACKEEGIFPDLDDESLKTIKSADDFKEAMHKQVNAMLDERQKQISEALEYGIEPDEIQKYQNAMGFLESLTEEAINDESDKGVTLRRQLIYNDYLNRGFSEDRAKKYTQRSFDQGTDIDDAIDAKSSNKEFYSSQYQSVVEEAKAAAAEMAIKEKQKADTVRKAILETEEPFDGIKLDKATRQKVFETISKPVYKGEDGNMYTALQKAQQEDEAGFIQKLGYLFTLTDGFKNLDNLVKGKVQKETKRGFQKIERALRTPPMSGEPRFSSGVSGIDEHQSGGITLDI